MNLLILDILLLNIVVFLKMKCKFKIVHLVLFVNFYYNTILICNYAKLIFFFFFLQENMTIIKVIYFQDIDDSANNVYFINW